ncbi:hypothetical protein D3Z52_08230 [Clostridiaceae bacterium]|nr:hypothetical protein [Clostridiaceae bacterium]
MLEVSDSALVMLALLFFFDSEGLLLPFLAAAALHELGHLLALRLTGGTLRRLCLTAAGGRMDCILPDGRLACCAVHFAGPAANLAAAALFRTLGFPLFAGANFVLSAFNLLPICPMDGYACLEAIAGGAARRARAALSLCFAILLCAAGSCIFCAGYGVSLAVIGTFLTVFSAKNLQNR